MNLITIFVNFILNFGGLKLICLLCSDSIYTERYMNKPNDNTDGYQSSSILPRASKLQDVDFLLIHGTGDGRLEVFKQKKTAMVT